MWRVLSLAVHVAVATPLLFQARNGEREFAVSHCPFGPRTIDAGFNPLRSRRLIQMRCTLHGDGSLAECRVLGDARGDLARLSNGEPRTVDQSFEFATSQIFRDARASTRR
jgi:hypothetical protein